MIPPAGAEPTRPDCRPPEQESRPGSAWRRGTLWPARAAPPVAWRGGRGLGRVGPGYNGENWSPPAATGHFGQPDRQPPALVRPSATTCWSSTAPISAERQQPRRGRPLRRCLSSDGTRSSAQSCVRRPAAPSLPMSPWSTARRRLRPDARATASTPAVRLSGSCGASSTATPSISSHRDGDGLLEDAWRYALDAGQPRLDRQRRPRQRLRLRIHLVADPENHRLAFQSAPIRRRPDVRAERRLSQWPPQRDDAATRDQAAASRDLPGTPRRASPDTKLLYAYLKHFGGICASHT